jgi:hypothetical protein
VREKEEKMKKMIQRRGRGDSFRNDFSIKRTSDSPPEMNITPPNLPLI